MMSSRFTQSQPHPHWHMPLTSNTRRACLLAERRRVLSNVASKQDISECRLHFFASSFCVNGFLQLWLASAIRLCFVFSFDAVSHGTQVIWTTPSAEKSNTEDNISPYAFYTTIPRNVFLCSKKITQRKSFTKTPLQACQTHLPSTALHRALSHLISALYAHKSAYTQQQCCMHATAWTSTTIQGREARHEPLTLVRKSAQASSDHTAKILWEQFKPEADDFVGLEMGKSWKG